MADITITAASVTPVAGAVTVNGTAGETIAAGKAVRLHSDGKWMLTDVDSATAAVRELHGVALNGASLNQPITVQTGGDINIGATVVVGTAYYASNTPGGIMPVGDLSSGEYVALLGIAITTGRIRMGIINTGIAV